MSKNILVAVFQRRLTTGNAGGGADAALFANVGLVPMAAAESMRRDGGCC